MPYYHLKRVWTPLEFVGIKLLKDQQTKQYFKKDTSGQLKKLWQVRK